MSILPPGKVKQGFWTNWSQGQVLGATITTDTTTANIVVAILAAVISLVSLHLWHLLLFTFYQIRANRDVADCLFRQQQALLRSFSSPEQTFWDFSKLCWTWRKNRNSIPRSLGPALVALLFSIVALATSLASSFIISTSAIPVLVDSNNCGYVNSSLTQSLGQAYLTAVENSALDYAKSCYLRNIPSGLCVKYVKSKLDFTTTAAPCPFSTSICISSEDSPAITMDTGYLDSNNDFGLNTVPKDRVQIRKKTTCAPIKVSGYYHTVDAAGHGSVLPQKPFPGQQEFIIEYGMNAGATPGTFNSYFGYNSYLSNFTRAYTVLSEVSGPTYGSRSSYIPIEKLRRSDADTNLIWIFGNAVEYVYPANDPVYSAHQKSSLLLEASGTQEKVTLYKPDHPLGAIACAEQYQFCITNADGLLNCTDLGGMPTHASRAALDPNANQRKTFDVIYNTMIGTDISIAGRSANANALLAFSTLSKYGVQEADLPNDQWKHEVMFWESFALSSVQNFLTSRAIGTGIIEKDGSEAQFVPPPTARGRQLCKEQKMMVQGGFANINVFGLAFTLAISSVIVLVDLLLLRVLVFFRKFRKSSKFMNIEQWIQDGVLQLQRKAYEGSGQGVWTRCDKDIPKARPEDQLYNFTAEHQKPDEGRQFSHATDQTDFASRQPSSTLTEKPILRDDADNIVLPMDNNGTVDEQNSSENEADAELTSPVEAGTIHLSAREAPLETSAASPV